MYFLDPFTYFLEGVISTALAPIEIICDSKDFIRFAPPPNQTCAEYPFIFL